MRIISLSLRSRGLIAGALLIANASAQTSTWIAPSSTTPRLWNDPANWDTGVPNPPTAIAVIGASTGGRGPLIDSAVEIDTLRFEDDPAFAGVRSVIIGGNYGAGLKTGSLMVTGAGAFGPSFGEIDVSSGSLTFTNDAKVQVRVSVVSDLSFFPSPQIVFADRSAAFGRIAVGSGRAFGTVTFRDESTMQGSRIEIGSSISSSTIEFRDQAHVVDGTIANAWAPSANSVVIRDSADTSGLAIDARAGTIALNIENAAGAVRVRSLTGRVDVQLGHNDLVLTGAPAGVSSLLDGKFSGSGGLSFLPSNVGEIGITNPNNDYTGQTTVGSTVALHFGGRLNNVRVAGGGLIVDSFGTVNGDLDVQGGSVSLVRISRYTSSLHVTGNYHQDSTSSLTLSLPRIVNVAIDGDAVLAGSLQLNDLFTPSVGTLRRSFLVAHSVVGKFDSVYGLRNTAMLRSRIDYGATDAALLIEQQPFANVEGRSRAAAALGAHLDATLPSTAVGSYYGLLAELNSFAHTADVRTALDALAPDRYSAMPDQAFADAAARETSLARQFAHGSALFFESRHAQRKVNAVDSLPRTESSIDGGIAGGAWQHGAWTLGAFVAHQNGRIELDDADSRAKARSTTPGVHGQLAAGEFHFDATASFTEHDYDLRRHVVYLGFDRTATASPAAREIDLALGATRVFRSKYWSLATNAGLLCSEWKADDFTEINADAAAMQVSGWRNRSLRSQLGVEIVPIRPIAKLQPRVALRWLHEFETGRPVRSRLASAGGDYYLAPGRDADADEFQLDVGLVWQIADRLVAQANLGVSREQQHRVAASDLSIGLRWQF